MYTTHIQHVGGCIYIFPIKAELIFKATHAF